MGYTSQQSKHSFSADNNNNNNNNHYFKSLKGCMAEGITSLSDGLIIGLSLDTARTLYNNITRTTRTAVPTAMLTRRYSYPLTFGTAATPLFAGVFFVSSITSSTLSYARQKEDMINPLVGFGCAYWLYSDVVIKSLHRMKVHNGLVGGVLLGSVMYGAWLN